MSDKHPIVVVALLTVFHGEILLGERIGGSYEGVYGTPGGKVDFGEELDKAAMRELVEETNLHAEGVVAFDVVTVVHGDQHFVCHFFVPYGLTILGIRNMEPTKCKSWRLFSRQGIHGLRIIDSLNLVIRRSSGTVFELDSTVPFKVACRAHFKGFSKAEYRHRSKYERGNTSYRSIL